MPKPEENSANENENSVNNNDQENSNSTNTANENSDSTNANNENTNSSKETVPLATFLKQKDELKKANDKLAEIENSQKERERKQLEESNQWKELYEKEKAEWENKFKELEPKAKSYDEIKTAELAELKKLLGEDWTDDMENIPIPTLKKLVDKKYPDKTPDTDGSSGKVAIKKRVEQLSESERKEANRMNLTLEDYVELKLKNEKKKE